MKPFSSLLSSTSWDGTDLKGTSSPKQLITQTHNFQINHVEKEEKYEETELTSTVAVSAAEIVRSFERKGQSYDLETRLTSAHDEDSPTSEEDSPASASEPEDSPEIRTLFEGSFNDVVCQKEVICFVPLVKHGGHCVLSPSIYASCTWVSSALWGTAVQWEECTAVTLA